MSVLIILSMIICFGLYIDYLLKGKNKVQCRVVLAENRKFNVCVKREDHFGNHQSADGRKF